MKNIIINSLKVLSTVFVFFFIFSFNINSAEAAVAYRSSTKSIGASQTTTQGTEPSGCTTNDIMIAFVYIESDTTVTVPTGGWSNTFNGTAMLSEANTSSHAFRMYGYWVRRTGSAPNFNWTHSSAFSNVSIGCYSGALTSGDPFSFGAAAVRDTTASKLYPDISGTTSVANELLVWAGQQFSVTTAGQQPTSPSFTERINSDSNTALNNNGIELADFAQAGAGGTGTVTGGSYTGTTNDTAASQMAGLKPAAVVCTATATGNWAADGTWDDATCGANNWPGKSAAGEAAIINANVTVTLTATLGSSVGTIDFNNPAATGANTLIINTGTTLTTTGNVTFAANTGTLNQTIQLNGTGIMNIGGNLNMGNVPTSSGSALVNTSTGTCSSCQLNVTGSTTVVNASTAVAGASKITMTTGATNVFSTGTLTITGNANGTGDATVSTATGTITVNGATSCGTTAASTLFSVSGAGILNLGGSLTANCTVTMGATSTTNMTASGTISGSYVWGNFEIDAGTTTLAAGQTVAGNWANNSGVSALTGNFVITKTGTTKTIGGTFLTPFYGINLAAASTTTLNTNATVGAGNFVFAANGASQSSTFTHASGIDLSVTGAATLTQASSSTGTPTATWLINAGTATVTGLLSTTGTSTGARITKITITTGTLNANGGITLTGTTATNKVIDMSGGAGNLNLKGALTVATSTLTAGTTSTFCYCDTVAQTINFFSAGAYANLKILNTAATGATLGAAVTTANVTQNITVGDDTVAALFRSASTFAIAGNGTKAFIVNNLSTFEMTSTSTFPSGFGTFTFDSNSTVKYSQTTSGLNVANFTYGNLILGPTAAVTWNLPATLAAVAGTLTIGDGATAGIVTAATNNTTITSGITGGMTILTGATFTVGSSATATTIGGNLTVTGTLSGSGTNAIRVAGDVAGAGTINLSGNTFEQRIGSAKNFGATSGSVGWNFSNLTFSNSATDTSLTVTTQTGGTGSITVAGNLLIGKSGDDNSGTTSPTTLNAGNRSWILSNTGTPLTLLQGPVGVLSPATSTFQYTNASATITNAATTYNNLTLGGTGTYTLPAANVTLKGDLLVTTGATVTKSASNTLIFANSGGGISTLTGNAINSDLGNIQISNIDGDTTLNLGSTITVTNVTIDNNQILDATAAPFNITVNGNWTNNEGQAGFVERTGTVFFATTSTAVITGSTDFYNFNVTGIGAAKTLQFQAGVTFRFNGPANSVTVTGTAGNLITITSTSTAVWLADFANTQNTLTYVNLVHSGCSTSAVVTMDGTSLNDATATINDSACWSFGAGGIIVSGSSNGSGTVNVAVNGVLAGQSAAISGGNWSISGVTVTSGQVVVAWINAVADASESTAVAKYDGTGNMTGMVLDVNVLSVGSADNQSISLSNLDLYECFNDEDIMYHVNASVFDVQAIGFNCGGGGSINTYTDETLQVLSGNTLDISGTETMTTDNLLNAGTLTSGGNSIYTVSGNWTNSGTFTESTSTTTFTATDSGHTINNGTSSFNNIAFNGTGGVWTATTNTMTILGALNITAGNFDTGAVTNSISGATNITAGTLTISSTTGTKTFTGNITVNLDGIWNETAAEDISFAGSLINNNGGTFTASTGVHTFTGSSKIISGIVSIPNLTINGSIQNSGTLTVSTSLAGTGTLTNAGGSGAGAFDTDGIIDGPSASELVYATVVDSNYMYIVGSDSSTNWRIEKRNIITGALCAGGGQCSAGAFDTDGVVDGVTVSDVAYSVAVDSNYIYITGSDSSGNWRIEKRNITTGALCAGGGECSAGAFDTDGVVNGVTASDNPSAISIDGNYLYVAGTDSSANWRIEKRNITTGALCAGGGECSAGAFDTDGVVDGVATTVDPTDLAIDGTYMYIIGNNDTATNWRIEKRSLSNGALCGAGCAAGAFDTDGVLAGVSSVNTPYGIAVDSSYMYVTGYDNIPNWRTEKRNIVSAALCAGGCAAGAFDTDGIVNGVTASEWPHSIAVDTNYVYVIGSDDSGNVRIEKRNITTGALCGSSGCAAGAFDTDGIIDGSIPIFDSGSSRYPSNITLDANYLYVVVYTGNWRIEKRNITTGALCAGGGECGSAFGTLNIGQATVPLSGGTLVATGSGNIVNYTAASPNCKVTTYDTLNFTGSGTVTCAVTTVTNDIGLSGTVSWTTGANLTVTDAVTVGNGTTLTQGSFTLSIGGLATIGGGSTGAFVGSGSDLSLLGNLTLAAGSTWTKGAGAVIFKHGSGGQTLTDNTASKQDLGSIQVSVNGTNTTLSLGSNIKATNITIDASQILDVTAAPFNITLNGSFTNNGGTAGFNARTGTVFLATTSTAVITGTTNFYTFNITGIGAAKTVQFQAGVVFGFTGPANSVTVTGTAGNLITITSTSTAVWLADFTNTQNTLTYVNLIHSGCSTSAVVTMDATSTNDPTATINDSACWSFPAVGIVISGTIYSDDGSSIFPCNTTNLPIKVALGSTLQTGSNFTCTSGGSTNFTLGAVSGASAGSILTVFIDHASNPGAVVTRALDGSSAISMNIYVNRLIARSEDATALTTTSASGIGMYDSDNDADIDFTNNGNNLSLAAGQKLIIWTGDTLTASGTITTSASNDGTDAVPAGDLTIQSSATLAMGANTLSVGGDYVNSGAITRSTDQLTTFTASSTGFSITTGTGDFENGNVSFTGGGSFTNTNAMSVSGSLTMTSGTLGGTQDLVVDGAFTGDGTVNYTAGTVTVTSGVNFGGDTAWTFNDLTFEVYDAPAVATGSGAINVTGVLNIAAGTQGFDPGPKTYVLSGTSGSPFLIATSLVGPNTSTFQFTGNNTGGNTTIPASANYHNITLNASELFDTSGTITLSGDLVDTTGTLQGTANITVNGGDVTGNGDINLSGGTFLVDSAGSFGGTTDWDFNNLTFGNGSGSTPSCPSTNCTTSTGTSTINVAGTLTVATLQTLNAGSKTWNLAGSTPLTVNGGFTASTSTVNLNSDAAVSVPNLTYNNLGLLPSLTSARVYTAAGALTVGGTLNINPTASSTTKNLALNLAGALNATGAVTITGTGTGTGQIDTVSTHAINAPSIDVATAGTLTANTSTITLSGGSTPFVVSGTFTAGGSTVVYSNATSATIAGTTYNNLTLGTSGTPTYTLPAADATIRGNTVINTGAIITKSASNKLIFAKGGGGTQTLTGNATNSDLGIVQVSANGGATTLSTSSSVKFTTITVDSSQNLDITSDTMTLTGTGSALTLSGTNTFTITGSTVAYTGTTATVAGTTFNHLTLGGTGTYTLPAADVTIRGNTVITTGAAITKSASNKIIFAIGGGTSQTLTGNATNSDLGIVQVSANTGNTTLNLGSSIKVTNLIIDSGPQVFVPGANTVSITGAGTGGSRPLRNSGTFTTTSSTVEYIADSATTTELENLSYNNLSINPTITASGRAFTGPSTLTVGGNMVINPTASSTTKNATLTLAGTANVTGSITLQGTTTGTGTLETTSANDYAVNAASMNIASGGILTANDSVVTLSGTGNAFQVAGTFTAGGSTIVYTNTSSANVENTTYNNLTLASASGTPTYTWDGSTTTVGGNLVIGGSGVSVGVTAATNDPTINVTGTTTINASAAFTPGAGTQTFGGTLTVNGTISGSDNGTTVANGLVNGSGTVNLTTAGTFEQRLGASNVFGSSSGSNNWNFFNLTFSRSAGTPTVTMGSGTGDITVAGALNIGKGSDGGATTLDAGTRTWILSAGGGATPLVITSSPQAVFTANGSTFQYTGNTANVTGATFKHLTLGGSGTYTLPAADMTLRGDLVVTNGASITKSAANKIIFAIGGGNTQTLNSNAINPDLGLLQISANGGNTTLATASDIKATSMLVDDSQNLNITGDTMELTGTSTPLILAGTNTFTVAGSTVKYSGDGATGILATTYNDLELSPSSSGQQVLGSGTFNVNGDLLVGDGSHEGATAASANPIFNVTGITTISPAATFTTGTGLWTQGGALLINGTLAGTANGTIAAAGDFTGSGTVNLTAAGTVEQRVGADKIFGPAGSNHWNFFNLTFGRSSGVPRINTQLGGTGNVTVNSILSVGKAGDGGQTILNPGDIVWTLPGNGTPLVFNVGSSICAFSMLTSNPCPNTSAFNYTYTAGGGSVTVTPANYYNLGVGTASDTNAASTFTLGGHTNNVSHILTIGHASSNNDDVFSTGSNFALGAGSVLITAGGILNANNSTITIRGSDLAGDFTNNGTFNRGNSTVVVAPGVIFVTIPGDAEDAEYKVENLNFLGSSVTNFHNFSSVGSNSKISFNQGSTFGFYNNINLAGSNAGGSVILDSVNGTGQWTIYLAPGTTYNFNHVVVRNSACGGGTQNILPDPDLFNGGNNAACWTFVSRSKIAPGTENITGSGTLCGGTACTSYGGRTGAGGGGGGGGEGSGGGGGTLPQAFTASNGTALSTYDPSWNILNGAFAINTNALHSNSASTDTMARWTVGSFNNNQYAQITLNALTSGSYVGVAVRAQEGAHSGYGAYADSAGVKIMKWIAGTPTELYSGSPFAVGDILRLEVSGTTLTLKKTTTVIDPEDSSESLVTSTVTTVSGQTDFTSGRPGLVGYGNSSSTRGDNFYAGSLSSQGGGGGGGGGASVADIPPESTNWITDFWNWLFN